MRKLLLVLFLFALSSNALAKEEIWKCDYAYFKYYKIDTTRNDIPKIYGRIDHRWIEEYPLTKLEYKKVDDAIWVYDEFDKIEWLFDLVSKEIIYRPSTKEKLVFRCKLYVK
jgi:hypothetical protein